MKITAVKATLLAGNKAWNLVRVETDEGITGIGECPTELMSVRATWRG